MLLVLIFSLDSTAQQPATGYSREILSPLEKALNNKKVDEHPNIQPAAFGLEQNFYELQDTTARALKYKNGIEVIAFGSLAGGYQFSNNERPVAGGFAGLEAKFHVRDRFQVQMGYALNAAVPPDYLQGIADSLHINPGVGSAINDGNNLYHTHYTYGNIAYNQGKHFAFEIGKGKHFWGEGYRSLILGDNVAPYPYARITTKVWKIKYTNLWAQMRDMSQGQTQLKDARIKYTALHALSLNATKRLNVCLYEMVVWQDRDSNSRRNLDINYLNPIIFYRPVEYSVGSPDNVILALSMHYKAAPRFQLYGQFVLDEFNLGKFQLHQQWWGNKIGGQLGFKAFDIFIKNIGLQSEANIARPFMYTHGSTIQSWTSLNQPLAHPMGNNFIEWVSFLRYDHNKWKFVEQFTWAIFGRDRDENGNGTLENLGGNIFRSYKSPARQYENMMAQGLKSTFYYQSFTVSRKIFPNENFEAFFSYVLRYEKNDAAKNLDQYLMLGIRASGLLQPQTDF